MNVTNSLGDWDGCDLLSEEYEVEGGFDGGLFSKLHIHHTTFTFVRMDLLEVYFCLEIYSFINALPQF